MPGRWQVQGRWPRGRCDSYLSLAFQRLALPHSRIEAAVFKFLARSATGRRLLITWPGAARPPPPRFVGEAAVTFAPLSLPLILLHDSVPSSVIRSALRANTPRAVLGARLRQDTD